MAKGRNTILLIGSAAALAYILYKTGAFKSFVSTYRLKLGKPSVNNAETQASYFTKLFLNLPLQVENNSAFAGKITGVKLDVMLNGVKAAAVSKTGTAEVAPNSTSTINLLVGIPTVTAPSLIKQIIQGVRGAGIVIAVKGALDTNQGLIDIDTTTQLL